MVKIITDSSSLYTGEEAEQLGFQAVPLCISIDDWHGRDLLMDMDKFYGQIEKGYVPSSSQPPIGDVIEAYENNPEVESINIAMADGLSGTYTTACSAKEMVEHSDKITVLNSRTLCGPHRYLVDKAVEMAREGKEKLEILNWLKGAIEKTDSFLMPQDFAFLKRGGRLTPLAGTIGGLLKLKPILRITPDGKRLDKFAVKRTVTSATASIVKHFEKLHIDERHIVYISHANVLEDAKKVKEIILEAFPKVEVQMFKLSPAFVTQGGPGCIAIQYIEK
ncbi:MAG: DegV family protein [Eubacteriales bacterium]